MKKTFFTVLGFFLFLSGMSALVLSLVGGKLAYLTFIDLPGPLFGFVARVVMIFTGIIMVVLSRTDWDKERQLSDSGQ